MIADPYFYALAVPALLVVGISKGGFGGGVAILGVPILSLAVPPATAAAVMLPILCLMDLFGLRAYWRRWDRPALAVMLPGALVGIALGGLVFGALGPDAVRLLLGLLAVGFSLHHFLGVRAGAAEPSAWLGRSMGALAGFTSTVAHAGGPPANMYLLPLGLEKTTFVGTMTVFFAALNYAKLVPYGLIGQLGPQTWLTALVLAPLAPMGMGIGIWLHRRVDARLFYRLCYGFLLVTGAKLAYDGLRNLL